MVQKERSSRPKSVKHTKKKKVMFSQDKWWYEDQKVELDEIEHSFWMNRETRNKKN